MESALWTSAFRQADFFNEHLLIFYWFSIGFANSMYSALVMVKTFMSWCQKVVAVFLVSDSQRPKTHTLRRPRLEEESTWLEESKQTYIFFQGNEYNSVEIISACSCPILWARRTAAFFLNAFQPPKELLKAVTFCRRENHSFPPSR